MACRLPTFVERSALDEIRPCLKFDDVAFGIRGIDEVGDTLVCDWESNDLAASRTTSSENLCETGGDVRDLEGKMSEADSIGSGLRAVKRVAVGVNLQREAGVSETGEAKMLTFYVCAGNAGAAFEFCSKEFALRRHRDAAKYGLIKMREPTPVRGDDVDVTKLDGHG